MKNLKKSYIKFEYVRIILYVIILISITAVIIFEINIPCFWKENFGITCPSCGITRATKSLIHFHIHDAMEYNGFYTLILVPFVLILFFNDAFMILKRKIFKINDISYVEILLGYGQHE